jgi:hypothetical protein
MPRNFSWLIPGKLAGTSVPKRPEQVGRAWFLVACIVVMFSDYIRACVCSFLPLRRLGCGLL